MSPPAAAPATGTAPTAEVLHASCISLADRAALILGPSGSGKSALALMLVSLGARLVADDRTELRREGPRLVAGAPAGLPAMIEARGIGLLDCPLAPACAVGLAVDLGQAETYRLPPRRRLTLLGLDVALVHGPLKPHFPAAILHYLRHGRRE